MEFGVGFDFFVFIMLPVKLRARLCQINNVSVCCFVIPTELTAG